MKKIPNLKSPAFAASFAEVASATKTEKATAGRQNQKLKIDKKEALQKQVEELTNKWKRALADYQNLEKRIVSEKQEWIKFSNALLINKLLEVLDSLEMAEKHLNDQGLSLAIRQLKNILKEEGIEEMVLDCHKFDPNFMECVETVAGPLKIEIVRKGYLLNKKVLRPAKVKVGSPDKI